MSSGKILIITAAFLFVLIGGIALFKEISNSESEELAYQQDDPQKGDFELIEIDLGEEFAIIPAAPLIPETKAPPIPIVEKQEVVELIPAPAQHSTADLPDADRIEELFSTNGPKLSIVETITYKSRVPWQKGRPAWLSDYASHFGTSRHFIARSLNGKPDYLKQDVAEGDVFNVLKSDRNIEFHLIVDTSRCKMWLYALDGVSHEKILLKTFLVSLGRPDNSKESGLLTPLGKYSLGSRVAIYKPGVMGHYKGDKLEMLSVFGTRWIPFDKEIGKTTAVAKGLGVHGVPWVKNKKGDWEEDQSSLGKYESDGCIRMGSDDMNTLFAIIIAHPTQIDIVKDFFQSEFIN